MQTLGNESHSHGVLEPCASPELAGPDSDLNRESGFQVHRRVRPLSLIDVIGSVTNQERSGSLGREVSVARAEGVGGVMRTPNLIAIHVYDYD